mmetsp:Transcript_10918/g.44676  ORF Transcript_10918/g.44676 Transcript_10918/m.44676 type:complete len:218 (-) Transcript_10918:65-718(-)
MTGRKQLTGGLWAVAFVAVVLGAELGACQHSEFLMEGLGVQDGLTNVPTRYLSKGVAEQGEGLVSTLILLRGELVNARRIFWYNEAIVTDLMVLLDLPRESVRLITLDFGGSQYSAVVELRASDKGTGEAFVSLLRSMIKKKDSRLEWTVLEYGSVRMLPSSGTSDSLWSDSRAGSDFFSFEDEAGLLMNSAGRPAPVAFWISALASLLIGALLASN